ncbi:hypothetical protein C8R46DRAFT_34524 [Mycena filopes]|nr:hypothetical protein C8R46DRAFT_34524 [Mycena filopes]
MSDEILTEIFHLSAPFDDSEGLTEIEGLARDPLLQLSKVCSHWHSVALGTAALWSTIKVNMFRWPASSGDAAMVGLLKSAVERGGASALTLDVRWNNRAPNDALQILTSCTERWYRVTFNGDLHPIMDSLSRKQGSFPRLHSLTLESGRHGPEVFTIFQDSPHLTEFSCVGPVGSVLPLSQLKLVISRANPLSTMGEAMSIMPQLPRASRFQLQCDIQLLSPFAFLPYALPSVSADIATLLVQIVPSLAPALNDSVLAMILNCLTLPALHALDLSSGRYPHRRLAWPHAAFLSLSSRSLFGAHLRVLNISDAVITADELIQCFSELPSLVETTFGDQQLIDRDSIYGGGHRIFVFGGGAGRLSENQDELLVVTDAFLRRLAWVPDSAEACLLPNLASFRIASLLQFDDAVMLEMVLSRMEQRKAGGHEQFSFQLRSLPEYHRKLNSGVHAQLKKHQKAGELLFSFQPVEYTLEG